MNSRERRSEPLLMIGIVSLALSVFASCGLKPEPVLDDKVWCAQVKEELTEHSVEWPVGNQSLSLEQVDAINEIFSNYSSRATGDLEVAAKGWSQGFSVIGPYLAANDDAGFEEQVSDSLKQQSFYASIVLSNICQW